MYMCWAVLYKAMNIPVPSLLTGCGNVGFSISTVLHAVCCILVRRTACSCVLCVVRVCVHSVLYSTYWALCCVLYWFVFTVLHYSTYWAVCCVLYRFVFTVLPYSTYRPVRCVLYRFLFTQCCLTALTELCVVCCTGLCKQCCLIAVTAITELYVVCCTGFCSQCCLTALTEFCVVLVCVHTGLPYSSYRAVCCVLYRFVFTHCCLTALTDLCVVCCSGLCSHSANLQHLQSSVQPQPVRTDTNCV